MASDAGDIRAPFTADELVAVTGGRLTAPVSVAGVAIDSRAVKPGQLFVAIPGERFDGHEYVEAASKAGAVAALVSRELPDVRIPQLVVGDTVAALQALARFHRERFRLPIVALTGSNGKTTTKEMIAAVLSPLGPVHKTPGNLNNHLGVPLTLLGIEARHRAAVVEMGMNHPGEIQALQALARPQVAVITNAGRAHLEGLGSLEAVVLAKSEIALGLGAGDTLIHFDDPLLREKNQARISRRLTFGFGPAVDFTASEILEKGLSGTEFVAAGWGRVRLRIPGRHNVLNALAALAVSQVLGVDPAEAVSALAQVAPVRGRMELRVVGGITIIDDTYNANPDSMRAALDLLRETPRAGRRLAVLGEMLELGKASQAMHREIGAAASFVDRLFVIGPTASEVAAAAVESGLSPEAAVVAKDQESLIRKVLDTVKDGDLILVKASRGMALEKVVQALETQAAGGALPAAGTAKGL